MPKPPTEPRVAPPPVGPLALVAASRSGAGLVARLGRTWPAADRFVLARYLAEAGVGARAVQPPLSAAVAELFSQYRGLVFCLPVGAVVRLIAPHLGDKLRDPGVVAVDDQGHFAVSVLAGHAGGGNVLAAAVAAVLGAAAVVTTAIESRGLPPPELIGRPFGWRLEASREALLRASAAAVNGEPLGVYQDGGRRDWLIPEAPVRRFRDLACLARAELDAAIVITDRVVPEPLAARSVIWRPRALVAGVGCSSGAPADELEALLRAALVEVGYAPDGLRLLATLDRKLAEPGLCELAARLDLKPRGYPSAELARVAVPNPSEIVRRAVGTPSVAEAAALLAAGVRELLLPKRASAHGTVALARAPGEVGG